MHWVELLALLAIKWQGRRCKRRHCVSEEGSPERGLTEFRNPYKTQQAIYDGHVTCFPLQVRNSVHILRVEIDFPTSSEGSFVASQLQGSDVSYSCL